MAFIPSWYACGKITLGGKSCIFFRWLQNFKLIIWIVHRPLALGLLLGGSCITGGLDCHLWSENWRRHWRSSGLARHPAWTAYRTNSFFEHRCLYEPFFWPYKTLLPSLQLSGFGKPVKQFAQQCLLEYSGLLSKSFCGLHQKRNTANCLFIVEHRIMTLSLMTSVHLVAFMDMKV